MVRHGFITLKRWTRVSSPPRLDPMAAAHGCLRLGQKRVHEPDFKFVQRVVESHVHPLPLQNWHPGGDGRRPLQLVERDPHVRPRRCHALAERQCQIGFQSFDTTFEPALPEVIGWARPTPRVVCGLGLLDLSGSLGAAALVPTPRRPSAPELADP